MINRKLAQRPDQVIDIASWPVHEGFEVYPVGARDKTLRVCINQQELCLPNHKYLFKESIKSHKDSKVPRHPDQYWSEIIAYEIGRLMGVSVPPAFVAVDSHTGEPGVAIEWFMGYEEQDEEGEEVYIPGGDLMQRAIANFDREKGRQHNLSTITTWCKVIGTHENYKGDWQLYWGLCLCFDALIGNTDRHQENWGLIATTKTVRFSPFFDNGTSLGHELFDKKIGLILTSEQALSSYVKNAKAQHHMKWQKDDPTRLPFIAGVERFCEKYPKVLVPLLKSLNWDANELRKILIRLQKFDVQCPLTEQRALLVQKLTEYRKQLLVECLEKLSVRISN